MTISSYPDNRMMNGEELTGLSAEELGKLEEMLKAGQNRVQEIKVSLHCHIESLNAVPII